VEEEEIQSWSTACSQLAYRRIKEEAQEEEKEEIESRLGAGSQ
jgi:hypothetical protein